MTIQYIYMCSQEPLYAYKFLDTLLNVCYYLMIRLFLRKFPTRSDDELRPLVMEPRCWPKLYWQWADKHTVQLEL